MAQIQLNSDLKVLPNVIDSGESFTDLSNRILVRLTDGGEEFQLSGTVTAYIIQNNGNTITVAGGISNNRAYIDLPNEVYDVPGAIQIAIRIGTTTIACYKSYIPYHE